MQDAGAQPACFTNSRLASENPLCTSGDIPPLSNCTPRGPTGRCSWEGSEFAGYTETPPRSEAVGQLRPCPAAPRAGTTRTHLGPVPGSPLVAAGVVLARLLGSGPGGRVALPLGVGAGHRPLLRPFAAAGGTLQNTPWTLDLGRLSSSPSTPRGPYQAPDRAQDARTTGPMCLSSTPPGLLESPVQGSSWDSSHVAGDGGGSQESGLGRTQGAQKVKLGEWRLGPETSAVDESKGQARYPSRAGQSWAEPGRDAKQRSEAPLFPPGLQVRAFRPACLGQSHRSGWQRDRKRSHG